MAGNGGYGTVCCRWLDCIISSMVHEVRESNKVYSRKSHKDLFELLNRDIWPQCETSLLLIMLLVCFFCFL